MEKVSRELGFERPITFHQARHSFAVMAINKGMRVEVLSKLLGHSSIISTEKTYARFLRSTVDDEIRKVMEVVTLDDKCLPLLLCYPAAVLQRLGYILEKLEYEEAAGKLYELCRKGGIKFRKTLLKASNRDAVVLEVDGRWKMMVNHEIDIDEI